MKTGFKVGDIMTRNLVTKSRLSSVQECAKEMEKHNISTVLIGKGSNIEGIVTEQDLTRKLVAKGKSAIETKAQEIMATDLITISPDKDVFDAVMMMKDHEIRHLPVFNNNECVGILAMKDIVKFEPQLFELMIDKLNIKEEENKPIHKVFPSEGICEECGEYTKKLIKKNEQMLCSECAKYYKK